MFRLRSLKKLGKNVRVAKGYEHLVKSPKRKKGKGRRELSPPQERLWRLVKDKYADAELDKKGLVPGRRWEVDIVIEQWRLAIETDGWAFHGKFKKDFLRDRQKDRALVLQGYTILRFTAGEIFKDPEMVMETIDQVVRMLEHGRIGYGS